MNLSIQRGIHQVLFYLFSDLFLFYLFFRASFLRQLLKRYLLKVKEEEKKRHFIEIEDSVEETPKKKTRYQHPHSICLDLTQENEDSAKESLASVQIEEDFDYYASQRRDRGRNR